MYLILFIIPVYYWFRIKLCFWKNWR